MIKLRKGSVTMAVRDENQAAAFLNNGWSKAEEVKTEKVDVSAFMSPPVIEENSTGYTKTDINRLSTADLKALATKEGIANADTKSGSELKKELIEHFNL